MKAKKNLSLGGHFSELRSRLIKAFLIFPPCFLLCWFFASRLIDILRLPIKPYLNNTSGGLIFLSPLEQVTAYVQVSFFSAILFSSPWLFHQIWLFICPGLSQKEQKNFCSFWFLSLGLFLSGALFAYFVVLPLLFSVLMNFGSGVDQAFISLKNYLSFVTRFVLSLALLFEMPLVLFFLEKLGLVSERGLRQYRRQAWLILAILSALITPPDILSLGLLFVPLIALYELSLLFIATFRRKKMVSP